MDRKYGYGYSVLARLPGERRGRDVAGIWFDSVGDARDWLSVEAGQYPDGTLIYITHLGPGERSQAGLKETYIVEGGEVVRQEPGRGWVPYRGEGRR